MIPNFTKEDVTLNCNIGIAALMGAIMRNYIVELIEHSLKGKEFQAEPELVDEIVRINNEIMNAVNKLTPAEIKKMNVKITIHCVRVAMAAYGVLLDSNIENVWMIFKAKKIPLLSDGKKEVLKFIREMRDCTGVSFDWRQGN